jgi:hypothetical protein
MVQWKLYNAFYKVYSSLTKNAFSALDECDRYKYMQLIIVAN